MPYPDLRKGRHSDPGRAYFVTAVTFNRAAVFHDFPCARIVVHELRRLHEEGAAQSLSWVVMPDHLHWLLVLPKGKTLSQTVRLLKGRSARAINCKRNRSGPLWQPGFHDSGIRDGQDLKALARYIVANPLRAGLTTEIGHYPHWDAAWL